MKNLKKLMERREELKQQLAALVDAADQEERAMTEEETRAFDAAEKEIQDIDDTLAREERARNIPTVQQPTEQHEMTVEERAAAEEKAFADFIMNRAIENRAGEIQLTQGNNGSIVPTTIANRIIKAVRDMVPFLQLADVVYTNGKLSVPVYGEDTTNYIDADYVDEGTDLTDNIGKFTTIDLTGFVIGALALVSPMEQSECEGALSAAKAAAGAYTGLDMEKTELEDLAYAVKVMAAEMIDNRQITAQYTGKNPMVMQILDLHSTNLLPSEG